MSQAPFSKAAGVRSASVDLIFSKIAPGQTVWMQVKGTSMAPTLRPADEVEVEIIDPGRLRFADLLVLDTPTAGLIIHRFFAWRPGGRGVMLTKGDASPRFDPPWPQVRFLGRVRAVRKGGQVRPCRKGWLYLGAARSLLVGFRSAATQGFKGTRG